MHDPEIRAVDLSLNYRGGPTVVATPSLTIPPASFVSFVGPNGGGKTTLLRSLAGLLPPQTGTVSIGDESLYGRRALSRRRRARLLSVVLTEAVSPAYLRVSELVALGRLPYQSLAGRSDDDTAAVRAALAQTGTAHLADRPVGQLSDGERQRVMIARALAQRPRILLLDEPAAHLDPPHQTTLFQLLGDLVRDRVVSTVIVATHHLHLAIHLTPTIVLVADGAVCPGSPAELIETGALERAFTATGDGGGDSDGTPPPRLDPHRGWFAPDRRADTTSPLW